MYLQFEVAGLIVGTPEWEEREQENAPACGNRTRSK